MPEIKMTRKELLDLNAGFRMVGNLSGLQFAYTIARNSEQLKSEIRAIQKIAEPNEAFNEYDKARIELAEKFAVKDNGVPKRVVEGNVEKFVIGDQDAFSKELDKLKLKHKKAIEDRQKQEKDLDTFLKGETSVVLFLLNFSDLPKDITPAQLEALSPILAKEDVSEVSKKAKK